MEKDKIGQFAKEWAVYSKDRTPFRGVLNDEQIYVACRRLGLLENYEKAKVRPLNKETGKAHGSHGLGHGGYDIKLGEKWLILKQPSLAKRLLYWASFGKKGLPIFDSTSYDNSKMWDTVEASKITLKPWQSVLAVCPDRFCMPNDLIATVFPKSSDVRQLTVCHVTPIEPSWEGFLTLEISNLSPYPRVLYAGAGIAQVIFTCIDPPLITYADNGKYQNQGHMPQTAK